MPKPYKSYSQTQGIPSSHGKDWILDPGVGCTCYLQNDKIRDWVLSTCTLNPKSQTLTLLESRSPKYPHGGYTYLKTLNRTGISYYRNHTFRKACGAEGSTIISNAASDAVLDLKLARNQDLIITRYKGSLKLQVPK